MKLSTLISAIGLACGTAEAVRIEIYQTTGPGLIPSGSTVLIKDDGVRVSWGNFMDGCKSNTKKGVKQICIDDSKQRAHVLYTGGTKQCFKRNYSWSELCGGDEGCWKGVCNRCWTWKYAKVGCSW